MSRSLVWIKMLAPNPEGAAKRQRAFTLFYRAVKNEFRRLCWDWERYLFTVSIWGTFFIQLIQLISQPSK